LNAQAWSVSCDTIIMRCAGDFFLLSDVQPADRDSAGCTRVTGERTESAHTCEAFLGFALATLPHRVTCRFIEHAFERPPQAGRRWRLGQDRVAKCGARTCVTEKRRENAIEAVALARSRTSSPTVHNSGWV
jgi:hypothetical protein